MSCHYSVTRELVKVGFYAFLFYLQVYDYLQALQTQRFPPLQ